MTSASKKKSWKQRKRDKKKIKEKKLEKKIERERDFLHLLNRIKNAVYVITIVIVLGMIASIFYGLTIYGWMITTAFFIIIGIIVLFMIYWPVGKEIDKRKNEWKKSSG
ncbi:MAG: hypothetical protein GF329_21520 [Candidatus Lokiarchaeota archaeon]|nr:hypothetical protein [Candidatus Lokiarchaeota archaeon]